MTISHCPAGTAPASSSRRLNEELAMPDPQTGADKSLNARNSLWKTIELKWRSTICCLPRLYIIISAAGVVGGHEIDCQIGKAPADKVFVNAFCESWIRKSEA